MYHTLNPAAGNYAHSHSHSHHAHASSSSSSSSFARHSLTSHPPPPPPSSTSSSSTNAANANAPAFHVPVLSQRTPAPPASLLHLTTPPNSSSSTSSFSHSHAQSQSQSHSHPHPPASMSGATTYSMPGPPPSPGLGSDDASWLTGGQDLFSGFLADDPAPGESLLTETEQKYFDMFLDWMATGTEPSHDAVEGMAAAANAAVASASRHPTPDTSLPSPAATTQGSIKSVGSGGGSQSLQQMQYVYDQQHQHHQAQPHLSPPSIHSSSFSARRHAPPPIQVQYGGGQQQHQHHQAQQHPSSASRSASFSHHTPLNGSILSPTSTYLSASDQQPLESPYLPASPTSPYPTPLTRPQHHHQQQQQPYPSQPQSHNGAATQPIQQLYALTPAGMVPVHVPTAALTAALEAQGIHTPGSGEHKLQHQPAAAATAPAHQVMYHHHPGQQQHQGQPTLVLASPPPTGTPSTGFVQPGATLLQQPQPQPQQPNVQPMLVQLVPLASPSPSNSGGMLGLPSPTYQMYTLPPPHHPQQPQPQPGVSVMGTGSAADAYATPAPSTPFGHAPHLGPAGRPRTLSTVSAMALDMGHLGLATPTAPTPRAPGAYLESPFFLHNQHGQAQQQQQQNATVHAPSTTLSVAPPPAPPMADVRMDDAHAQDDEGQVHDFSIPAHAPTLDLVLPSPPADDPAAPQLVAKPLATRKRAGAAAAANKPSTAGAAPASRKRARASSSLADAAAEPAAVDAELKSTAAGSGKVTKRKPAAKTKASKPPAAAPMDTAIDGVPVNSHSEKRRRTLIRLGFQQLVDLVPELRETARVMAKPEAAATATGGDKVVGGHTVSKATILTKSFEYMRTVQRKIAKYGALVVQLEAYAARVGVAVPPPAEAAAAAAGEDGMDVDREQPELAHHLVAAVGGSS